MANITKRSTNAQIRSEIQKIDNQLEKFVQFLIDNRDDFEEHLERFSLELHDILGHETHYRIFNRLSAKSFCIDINVDIKDEDWLTEDYLKNVLRNGDLSELSIINEIVEINELQH